MKKGIVERLRDWIERRFLIKSMLIWAFKTLNFSMPKSHVGRYKLRAFWLGYSLYYLGSIICVFFLILAVTGILLALYYTPSAIGNAGEPTPAYQSVQFIMTKVWLGNVLRGVHHWAANLLVASVALHLLRVFFTSAYREPRELNWIMGMVLFLGSLLIALTGYILPWDQLSYWAGTIGLELTKSIPIIGETLAQIAFGGSTLSPQTLVRFYSLHVSLSMIGLLMIAIHVTIVWVQGIAEPH